MDKQYFLKRLVISKPSALQSFSYDLLPSTFKCQDEIPIECREHGVFYKKAFQHLFSGTGCRECSLQSKANNRALTTTDFIYKSKSRFGDKFNYDKTNYIRGNIELTITCPVHKDITLTPNQHSWLKYGCSQCDFEVPRIISKAKILEKAKKIHNDKYDYSHVDFVNVNKKVEIICPFHGSFWQGLYSHTKHNQGCMECSRFSNRLTLSEFISKSKTKHGDCYDYDKVDYKTNNSMVIITCKKHGDFTQRAGSHLAGSKCRKCYFDESKLSKEEFVKNARLVHGDSYDYSRAIYRGNKRPVEIICSTHGSFWQKPNSHTSSRAGCRLCYESKGEKAVEVILKKYGIKYIREYRIKPYLFRYDFYLPEFNIYIEFNGVQHYKPVNSFGGKEAFLSCKERDEEKKSLVQQANGKLIVLTFLHLIHNTVEKQLILSLKKIYKYWFVTDGKLQVFKTEMELYTAFNISLTVGIKNIITEVKRTVKDCKILF